MSENESMKTGDCACYNTRKAARLLAQAYDRALEPSGLKNTQFSALAVIYGSDDGLTITELAAKMSVERTTLTRNLSVLVRNGLVRIDAGADARSKLVAITAAGRKALDKAIPLWERIQSSVTGSLGDWPKLRREIETLANVAREAR